MGLKISETILLLLSFDTNKIIALSTLATAIFAAWAALIAKKKVDEQKKIIITENRPFMVITSIEANPIGESNNLSVFVYFHNSGKGLAKIRVIDLNARVVISNPSQ